MQMDVTG